MGAPDHLPHSTSCDTGAVVRSPLAWARPAPLLQGHGGGRGGSALSVDSKHLPESTEWDEGLSERAGCRQAGDRQDTGAAWRGRPDRCLQC